MAREGTHPRKQHTHFDAHRHSCRALRPQLAAELARRATAGLTKSYSKVAAERSVSTAGEAMGKRLAQQSGTAKQSKAKRSKTKVVRHLSSSA